MKKIFVFLVILLLFCSSANAIDLRTFQSNGNNATITETSISATFNSRQNTFFTVKKYGKIDVDQSGHFKITSGATSGLCNLISWGTVIGDLKFQQSYTMFGLYFYDTVPEVKLISVSNSLATYSTEDGTISKNTDYYYDITKTGTAGSCSIYSDVGKTILVVTLTITSALTDTYNNQCLLGSYNDNTLTGAITATVSNVIDNLDTFSISTPEQRTSEATVTITGVSPISATVTWTGTGGAVSGNTTADGLGDWSATVTLGTGAENVLTFTTAGETDQIVSITQGGVDYTIDSSVIDTTTVASPIFGPVKADVLYDGLFVQPFWSDGTDLKVKPGTDEGAGLTFKTLKTPAGGGLGITDSRYTSTFNDVDSSFHLTTLIADTALQQSLMNDDYSVDYDYDPMLGGGAQFDATMPYKIVSSCITNLNWTYVIVENTTGDLKVYDSDGTLNDNPNSYTISRFTIPKVGVFGGVAGQILCGLDNQLFILVGNEASSTSKTLDLYTSVDGITYSAKTPISTELIDYKFIQGVVTSDGQLRMFYVTPSGLKCRTLSALGLLGAEVSVLDNVTSFTATAVNSADDKVMIGIGRSPYLLNYMYTDGVFDSVPVQLYDDVLAGVGFITSPVTEPQVVPTMFQNMAGYMVCTTSTHIVAQRATSGLFVGVGRSEFCGPLLLTHQQTGFDKSIIAFGKRDDWGYTRSYDWTAAEFENIENRAVTQKYADWHSREGITLDSFFQFWIAEGGRTPDLVKISVTDNPITTGADVDLVNTTLLSPGPNIGSSIYSRGYKEMFVDSSGNVYIVHMDFFELYIDVFDGVSWTSYNIYNNPTNLRMYWQGARMDSAGKIHIGISTSEDNLIPISSAGSTNSLRLDYLKLTYTGSSFTAVGADAVAITLPCVILTSDNVITAPDAATYYSVPASVVANPALTTTDMLYIGYFDKRGMELDSLNNPIFAQLQVGIIDYEDAKGVYVYRRNGSVWQSVTISTDVNLDALQPIIVKSADGDSLIVIYAISDITYFKVSSDDGATWGVQKLLFDEAYPIKQIFPVASSRGLDIISEKHVDRSYTEITLQSVLFAFGAIQITIEDSLGDPVVGATYTIDGEGAYISGELVAGVQIGSRTLSFSVEEGYLTPADRIAVVEEGVTTTDTVVYIISSGAGASIRVGHGGVQFNGVGNGVVQLN